MKLKKIVLMACLCTAFSSSQLFSETIITGKTENTCTIKVTPKVKTHEIVVIRNSTTKEITPTKPVKDIIKSEFDFKTAKDNVANIVFSGTTKQDLIINGLAPATSYTIDTYQNGKKVDSKQYTTLASEPKKQTTSIAFKDVTDSHIGAIWMSGDGENRIVCVSTDKGISKPIDGIEYPVGKVGDAKSQLAKSNTYVVYNSASAAKPNSTLIKDLLSNTAYTVKVIEYNGKGESINYLTDDSKNNPRTKLTFMAPPVALEATSITKDGFQANWKEMTNIKHFEFDLSTDEKFSSFVDIYQAADVGNLDRFEFTELTPGTYYYRIRAVGEKSISSYSNVIKVTIK